MSLLGLIVCLSTYAQGGNTKRNEDMNDYKKQATLWYEAFCKKDPAILDRILSEDWVDIPSPPGTPADRVALGITTDCRDVGGRLA